MSIRDIAARAGRIAGAVASDPLVHHTIERTAISLLAKVGLGGLGAVLVAAVTAAVRAS